MNNKQVNHHPLDDIRKRCQPKDRSGMDRWFSRFCIAVATLSIVILAVLLFSIFYQGLSSLNWNFLTHYPEPDPKKAGMGPSLWGSIWVIITCGLLALPIGVATAILLEEFPPTSRIARVVHSFIQLNISNLAGVPSVVYGILGLALFVSMGGWFGSRENPKFELGVQRYDQFFTAGDRAIRIPVKQSDPPTIANQDLQGFTTDGEQVTVKVYPSKSAIRKLAPSEREFAVVKGKKAGRISDARWYHFRLPFDRSVLAGGLTLMLVILPIVIISSQEAIRGVPSSLREAGLGLGATRWQVVRNITLPAAIPGIMTGAILAISRAIGEAAPILMIAGVVFITSNPESLMDSFTVMPLQIYNWTGRPVDEFREIAGAGIIVLLIILFAFNAVAVLIRQRTQKPLS